MPKLFDIFKPIKTNDIQITRLKGYLNEINNLKGDGDFINERRLHWLKFWCNRAVELYGNDAVIKFS